jgi:hypothetical protein
VTRLLQHAFAAAARLPVEEQDLLASRLLVELAPEDDFDRAIAQSSDKLAHLGEQAIAEHRARPDRGTGPGSAKNPRARITDDHQLQTTLDRIARFQEQVRYLRGTERDPVHYRAAVSGFLAELDRMHLEIREYFSLHPTELVREA